MVVTGVGAWPQPRTQDGLDRRVASPQPQLLHLIVFAFQGFNFMTKQL